MKANTTAQGILLFWLSAGRRFAIGTLKVKEIVPYTPLTAMPQPHPAVLGAASIRGGTIPVVDMSAAMGLKPLTQSERDSGFIVVSDCQRKRVGFLVRALDRIVDRDWRDIEAPPKHLGRAAFTAGVTRVDEELVQVVDLELIYANIYGQETVQSDSELADDDIQTLKDLNILMVDDSAVARRQLADALNALGIGYRMTPDGQEALDIMTAEADAGHPVDLLVSDIEMPGLDGYELAFGVRDKPALAKAYIILHTSISSEISVSQAHQVGANEALTKFDVDELIQAMLRGAYYEHTA